MSKEEKLSTQLGRFEKEQNRTFRSENIITKIKEPMNMVNKWLDSAEERLSKLEDRAKIGRERQRMGHSLVAIFGKYNLLSLSYYQKKYITKKN